jgi:hypothetical protein
VLLSVQALPELLATLQAQKLTIKQHPYQNKGASTWSTGQSFLNSLAPSQLQLQETMDIILILYLRVVGNPNKTDQERNKLEFNFRCSISCFFLPEFLIGVHL